MPRSLGKMSAYKLFNWRDRAANTILETVQAFLELGEAVATRWIQTRKGVMLLQMVPGDNASGAIYVFDRLRDTGTCSPSRAVKTGSPLTRSNRSEVNRSSQPSKESMYQSSRCRSKT